MLREAIFVVFGEDQVTIDDDVKDPARAFDEVGLDAERAFDCLRQTGGLGQVVSHPAVLDADLHADDSKRTDVGIFTITLPRLSRSDCNASGGTHVLDEIVDGSNVKRPTLRAHELHGG